MGAGEEREIRQRNTTVDFLRIVCMFCIVVLHAVNYGLRNVEIASNSWTYLFTCVLKSFSIISVNCFVLITGYYMSGKETNISHISVLKRYKRLIPLWVQILFYSVGVYLLVTLFREGVTVKEFILQWFPIFSNQYWFATIYFLLILVSPFLDKLINSFCQNEYQYTLIVLIVFFSVIPTINVFGDASGVNKGFSLIWFVVLYFVAGYLKMYPPANIELQNIVLYAIISLILSGLRYFTGIIVGHGIIGTAIGTVLSSCSNNYNSPIVLFSSVCLFLSAKPNETNIVNRSFINRHNGIIYRISKLSFGVYLFHEHNSVRYILWQEIVHLEHYSTCWYILILAILLVAMGIFCVGIAVDAIRDLLFSCVIKMNKNLTKYISLKQHK